MEEIKKKNTRNDGSRFPCTKCIFKLTSHFSGVCLQCRKDLHLPMKRLIGTGRKYK